MLDEAVAFARRHEVNARKQVLSKQASVAEAIVVYAANERVDLIVIGTRELGGFKRLLIGSTTVGFVTRAHCSVLVVR
ncbi:MAG: universal stress protein [Nitrososphaerota archaeon]|nr:universal stress protein [Nitrososphaerota archaeon]